MNTTTVSNFFSRDALLRRQARTLHARQTSASRTPPSPPSSSSATTKSLHIIVEEDEQRLSLSRARSESPMSSHSPTSSLGGTPIVAGLAKRRPGNLSVSEIRLARDSNDDLSAENLDLLTVPRPAPRPPRTPSPNPSPDSFRLTFTDASYKFPHPPIPAPSSLSREHVSVCGSPTPSMSSASSSACSDTTGLPTTPPSSDDEFSLPLPSPRFNPRRAAIRPLNISKRSSTSAPSRDLPLRPSLLQSFAAEQEQVSFLPFSSSSDEGHSESDAESDSEWYSREFSKILTLCSPIPPTFPVNKTRPESMSIPSSSAFDDTSSAPSKPAQPSSPPAGFPSGQLDPAFPRRKRSRRIPSHAPPPVPPIPAHLRSQSTSSIMRGTPSPPPPTSSSPSRPVSTSISRRPSIRRPPPRSSIPADFVFNEDDSSEFSFSLYEDMGMESPKSAYSQPSFQGVVEDVDIQFPVDDIRFDLDIDYPMMLPLSIPGSPIDLEADFVLGLEELKSRECAYPSATGFVLDEMNIEHSHQTTSVTSSPAPPTTTTTTMMTNSFTTSPIEERGLKSKWSSSTLASIREEHEKRLGPSKLKLYFGNSSPLKQKRGSASSNNKKVPTTPTSPMMKGQRSRRESDVMVIGYGQPSGLRRRGSMTPTISDAGSAESTSSSGSNGLRRKPIPVEMFLRSGI